MIEKHPLWKNLNEIYKTVFETWKALKIWSFHDTTFFQRPMQDNKTWGTGAKEPQGTLAHIDKKVWRSKKKRGKGWARKE